MRLWVSSYLTGTASSISVSFIARFGPEQRQAPDASDCYKAWRATGRGKNIEAFFFPPSLALKFTSWERGLGTKTLTRTFAVLTLNHSRRAKNVYVLRGIEYLRYLRSISSAFRREHDCTPFLRQYWVDLCGTIFTGSWSAMRKLRYQWLL